MMIRSVLLLWIIIIGVRITVVTIGIIATISVIAVNMYF